MRRTETRTIEINVTRAELQQDGYPHSLPLQAMRCHETNTYDYNPVLRERTGGTMDYEADVALWDGWFLRFSAQFGGPHELVGAEFTLVVTGTTDDDAEPKEYKFNRFWFTSERTGKYMSRDPNPEQAAA